MSAETKFVVILDVEKTIENLLAGRPSPGEEKLLEEVVKIVYGAGIYANYSLTTKMRKAVREWELQHQWSPNAPE